MNLYRIISGEEWDQTKQNRKVPRCKSDERDNCVHLTRFEDLTLVATKYFTIEENPVVLEVDITDFNDKIIWREPTLDKTWKQPDAQIPNIEWRNIKGFAHFMTLPEKEGDLIIGKFQVPGDNDESGSGN